MTSQAQKKQTVSRGKAPYELEEQANIPETRRPQAVRPLVKPYAIISVFLVLFTAMSFTLVRSIINLNNARAIEADLIRQIEAARILSDELTATREYMKTPLYIEREARVEYGLSLPGTIRYAFGSDTVASSSDWIDYNTDSGI
jgi:cell division protein FtsB